MQSSSTTSPCANTNAETPDRRRLSRWRQSTSCAPEKSGRLMASVPCDQSESIHTTEDTTFESDRNRTDGGTVEVANLIHRLGIERSGLGRCAGSRRALF